MICRVRHRADAELDEEAVVAEDLVLEEDLLDDLLRAADEVRAAQRRGGVVVLARVIGGQPRSRPIRFIIAANVRERLVERLPATVSAMKPCELMLSAGAARGPPARAARAVELGERREALGQAADDRERHRQAERAGADRRLGRAADRDPDRQRILQRPRVDAAVVDRRAVRARPA